MTQIFYSENINSEMKEKKNWLSPWHLYFFAPLMYWYKTKTTAFECYILKIKSVRKKIVEKFEFFLFMFFVANFTNLRKKTKIKI